MKIYNRIDEETHSLFKQNISIVLKMRIPIVVIHEGNQPYVRKCLEETLRHNPNNVILLGDDTNVSMCKEIGVKHIHINSLPVSEQRVLFTEHFVNYSSNSYLFEMRCFLKYFRLFEFMDTYKVDKVVHLDSDAALLCNLNVWQHIENGLNIPKERKEAPLRMSNSDHTAVKTIEYVRKFIELCNDIYVTKKKHYLIEEKVNYHKKVPGGICDMTVCYLLNITEKNVSNLFDPSSSTCGGVTMNHIGCSEGYLGLKQYEINNGLLSIYLENNRYYLYDTIRKKHQLLLNLHFQGTSKNLLDNGHDISTLPNIIRSGLKPDSIYWQYPVITEKKFYEQNCEHPNYVGLPWATILDKKMDLTKMYIVLKDCININDSHFTCCQHIKFRELISLFKKINIKVLFSPHKVKEEDYIDGIEIKPCPLYAVNVEDDERNQNLKNKDFMNRERKYLYSFQGAYMTHYLTPIRKHIFYLHSRNKDDVFIQNIGKWHFDEIVYTENQNSEQKKSLSDKHKSNNTIYNELLLDSIFTLCPSGAGPNSIRLWESLAVGSIPVLLSDTLDLPKHELWKKSVLFVAEIDIHIIDVLLRSISTEEIKERRTNCIALYNHFKNNFANNYHFETKTLAITTNHDTPPDGNESLTNKSGTSREIIHYCCGSYDTHNYGGVARYDYHIKMIYPERKFFTGPQQKSELLEFLKRCVHPLVITDNHLSCDIPNEYDVFLVNHGCARRTDEVSKNWDPYWRKLCVNGQNQMLKYRTPEKTHIISISQDVYNCFTSYYGNEYKRFKNTKILHTSELNESKYHDYAHDKQNQQLQILGNWGGYKKGDISKLQTKLSPKYAFNKLRIQPSSFRNIQMFNDVKQIMYLQNDIFLQLSASEGNSYATLDAILCGMVIVSTPVVVFGGDVPEDCFVKIELDKIYDVDYMDKKIQYAWNNRIVLSEKIRTWYVNNCRFETWKIKMKELIG